ncbi:hypothetical protein [Actinoallomurus sp. CA-150999]|uniref:hypothetical protein n=1 Tax=Actinoallomurus sp. CA-150999 TaxID=3239887 RepID=UPI003D921519
MKLMRKLTLAVAPAVLAAGVTLTSTAPAHALGHGRVCVFLAPQGAKGNGHVGWAFQEPPKDHWFFGATEGQPGEEGGPNSKKINPGQNNGAWEDNGTWQKVLDTFRNVKAGEHPGGYYKQYTCKNTTDSSVHAADLQGQANKGRGYYLWGNNCMNHSYDVLKSYGAGLTDPNNPKWISNWRPNDWVDNLILLAGFEHLANL